MARRRDDLTPEAQALRDAYLAEIWPTCPEVPRDVRAGWAAVAEVHNERLAESTVCGRSVDAA